MPNDKINQYIENDLEKVGGWLSKPSAKAIADLLSMQTIKGNLLEIGVHEGRLFLILAMALQQDELALAIDLFSKQELNISHSGYGNLGVFEKNLQYYCNAANVKILEVDSNSLGEDFIQHYGKTFRFISVDGGHDRNTVLGDIILSTQLLSEGGIIAFDDFYRMDWSGVTAGLYQYYKYYEAKYGKLYSIAFSDNKFYVTNSKSHQSYYQAQLQKYKGQLVKQEVFDDFVLILN